MERLKMGRIEKNGEGKEREINRRGSEDGERGVQKLVNKREGKNNGNLSES